MSNTPDHTPDEPDTVETSLTDAVVIHRAPRYTRFFAAGGVLGILVALVLTFSFPAPDGYNVSQVFGFLAILCVVVGIALGSIAALIFERLAQKRSATLQVERVDNETP